MKAKYSLSMSRMVLLLAGAVLCALPLSAQEVWREGHNIGGLTLYEGNRAEASLGGSFTSGGFRLPSEAASLWQTGAQARTESHYKDLLFVGAFSFDVRHGKDMMGSMFTLPGYYPIDVLEFTPGPKTRQTYGLGGGMALKTGSRWIPGFTLQFQGINYSKRKDLRHTTYRQELQFSPSIFYNGDRWKAGAALILDKNSEFIQAEQIGTATAETYLAFLDKGKRYGILEAWDGGGIHLADPGVDRLAVNQLFWGLMAQVSLEERLFGEVEYSHSAGHVGEKGYTWYRFPGEDMKGKALWNISGKKGVHTLGADVSWSIIHNFESVIDRVTTGGVTVPAEYAGNHIYEKRTLTAGTSYGYESGAGWGLSALASVNLERDLGTYMFPYLNYDASTVVNLALAGHGNLGPFTLEGGVSFRQEVDEDHDIIDSDEEEDGVLTFPSRLDYWWDAEEEYSDISLLGVYLNLRYNFMINRKFAFFVEAGCSLSHAFGVILLPGSNRQSTHLTFGYNF